MSKVTKLTFAFVALMATILLAICPAYAQGTEVPPPTSNSTKAEEKATSEATVKKRKLLKKQ